MCTILSIIDRDDSIYLSMFDRFRDVVEDHFLDTCNSTKKRVEEHQKHAFL